MHACVFSGFSRVWLFATLWTVAHRAPPSMGFPRQADWIGLPCLPPGCLPDPGWTHVSCSSYTVGRSFTTYNSTLRTIICLVAQSCLTLCNPVDCRLPGSTVHGLSRQEYWLPFPSPGDLPIPGMELLHCRQILYSLSQYGITTLILYFLCTSQ